MRMVTLPVECWDACVLLLIESSRTLKREGEWDMAVDVLGRVIPAMLEAVSPCVRMAYEAELAGAVERGEKAVA